MKMNNLVVSVKIINHDFVIATASVTFITEEFGPIVVKDYRITKSKFGTAWVHPPQSRFYNRYHERVFLENKNIWEQVEKQILSEYEKTKTKYLLRKSGEVITEQLEEVLPDKIDV